MRDYIITVNSTVDTGKEWLEERNVPVIPLKYTIDGQEYKGCVTSGIFISTQWHL